MKRKKRRLKKKPFIILILIIVFIIFGCYCCSDFNNKESVKNNEINNKKEKKVKDKKKEDKENKRSFSLVMVGDVLIHDAILKDALVSDGTYDFSNMFEYIKPVLNDYDLKYCNQESTIGGKKLGISGYPSFNAPDEIGEEISNLGFNLVSLANNHALDKGEEAIKYSVNFWKKYDDIVTAGSYLSNEDRDDLKIYEINGIKYAFLSYTTSLNNNNLNGKDYLVNLYDKDKVKEDIEKVSSADFIMVAMHWGNEYTNEPTKSQRDIAEYLSSLGVDLIIGAHPHVVQPITYIGNTLVIYSLGNFISNQLVVDTNRAIGLMVGIDVTLDDQIKIDINKKELIFSYSDNGHNFKVVPFSMMNDNYLKDFKSYEEEYMNIVNKEL